MKRVSSLLAILFLFPAVAFAANAPDSQLDEIRTKISSLESRLVELAAASADVAQQREQLNAELALAEARVLENELTLEHTRAEVAVVRSEAAQLAQELMQRRELLLRHLEMVALLGQPGPLQLIFDVAEKGELEQAVSTIGVLTSGQVRLFEEYNRLRSRHSTRLAALSQILQQAQHEARELVVKRQDLEQIRRRVEKQLLQLQRSQRSADARLTDLKEREQALQRLMATLTSRDWFIGKTDIRRYRGALPWPVEGRIARGFGRHYLPTYSTYTVCNGLRFDATGGIEVQAIFPGVVAFAQHFKGYGNMVVIDHGHGVFSLVAGLATIHVRLNQSVSMGLRLGLVAPPADDGNLYFEIRVDEEPQDPRRWLQLEEDR
jgi:septal ring factor EnvC (AmiA/AmiB activator)